MEYRCSFDTYGFLSKEEQRVFTQNEQKYLIKQVKEYNIKNVVGSKTIELDSLGLVSGLMFFLKRSDIHMRNEWTNKTNWPYDYMPYDIKPAPSTTQNAPTSITHPILRRHPNTSEPESLHVGPGVHANGNLTGRFITGDFKTENIKHILDSVGILFNGSYRENVHPRSLYDYIEKYTRTSGNASEGLYCYNFSLNDSPFTLQPSGAANLSLFDNVALELTTIVPPLDPNAQTLAVCDPDTGDFVGINKPTWRLYDYDFDMTIFEERYNVITFTSGNCGLSYAI